MGRWIQDMFSKLADEKAMHMRISQLILTVLLAACCTGSFAQKACTIKKYISQDGSLYFHVPHDTIYYTKESRLMAAIITDKENYFLSLAPFPKPGSLGKKKEYQDLKVTLANKAEINLKFFDARFPSDSNCSVTFLVDKKMIDTLKNNEIESIYLKTPFEDKQYRLILHRDLVRQHLACLESIKNVE